MIKLIRILHILIEKKLMEKNFRSFSNLVEMCVRLKPFILRPKNSQSIINSNQSAKVRCFRARLSVKMGKYTRQIFHNFSPKHLQSTHVLRINFSLFV